MFESEERRSSVCAGNTPSAAESSSYRWTTQAPPIGTKGTVRGVDDIGSIMVRWDNGCTLSVAYGEDMCRRIDE